MRFKPISESAAEYGRSVAWHYRKIGDGVVQAVKVGGRTMVDTNSVKAALAPRAIAPRSERGGAR